MKRKDEKKKEEEEVDEYDYERLIWPIMTSCRIIGCWPVRSSIDSLWGRIRRGLLLVLLICEFLGTSAEVAVFWGVDMNDTIEGSLIASAFFMAILRVIVFSNRQRDMLFVVESMKRDWTSRGGSYDAEERELLRRKCELAYGMAKFFITSVAMASMAFAVMPILEETVLHKEAIESGEDDESMASEHAMRVLPFRGYYFFNHTVSPRYECVYLVNALIGLLGCSTIAAATSFSLVATIHASAKFSIVQRDFGSIDARGWTSGGREVERVVRRHWECIRFAEKVEIIINFLALAQFVISTGLMCFAGFQLTTMLEDRTRLMKYTSFLQSAIMELFIFSYSGQKLKTESEDVAELVYASDWVGALAPTNLKLVSMRARKPCTITAGKFYDMSLESFLKVLSSSFSYFTVLLAMKEE